MTSFVSTFSAGKTARVDALFAPAPLFRWLSSNNPGLRNGTAAMNRATLGLYVTARHRQHDRLQLLSFKFNGNSAGYGNFEFTLRRAADDYQDGAWFRLSGKGAAVCSHHRAQLIVLSLGGPGSA